MSSASKPLTPPRVGTLAGHPHRSQRLPSRARGSTHRRRVMEGGGHPVPAGLRPDESERLPNDPQPSRSSASRRSRRGSGAPRASTEPFAIQALTIPDALAGRDVLRQGQDRLGQDPGLRPPAPRARRRTAAPRSPAALVLVPTRELALQVTDVLEPLGEVRGRRRPCVVYGGADMDRQITALHKGVDVVVATPGRLIDLIERGELSVGRGRDRRARRGRPHGRHGLPAPGRVDPAPGSRSEHQTMLFSATLDGDGRPARQPLPARPGSPRGGVGRADRRRDGAPSSCRSTRWTR